MGAILCNFFAFVSADCEKKIKGSHSEKAEPTQRRYFFFKLW